MDEVIVFYYLLGAAYFNRLYGHSHFHNPVRTSHFDYLWGSQILELFHQLKVNQPPLTISFLRVAITDDNDVDHYGPRWCTVGFVSNELDKAASDSWTITTVATRKSTPIAVLLRR